MVEKVGQLVGIHIALRYIRAFSETSVGTPLTPGCTACDLEVLNLT